MRFTKMHGIGNDYVYVNGFEQAVGDPVALALRISDRHFGVGGDGLILILPPDPPVKGVAADLRMRMFNADGSESEMCGNGVRCVCKFAADHGLSRANPMRVQTGRGVLSLAYTLTPAGNVDQVTVDMGQPILAPRDIPVRIADLDRIVNHPVGMLIAWPAHLPEDWINHCGLDERMTCVSMGNPHAVFFCDRTSEIPLAWIGPVIEHHEIFPKRVNAHFVEMRSRHEMVMRTWERGSGITLACGTGAAAVCVAGVLTERADRQVLIHLPGGDLNLDWRADNHVYMTGPATEVFSGEWPE